MVAIVFGVTAFPAHLVASPISDDSTTPSLTSNTTIQNSPSPDFSITANPNYIIQNGANFNSQIQISSLNGFTQNVDLSVVTNSTNFSCSLSPKTITGGSGNSYLSCSSSTSGTYLATVTGTSGTLSHSSTVTEYYPPPSAGFVIWANPTGITDTTGDYSNLRNSFVTVVQQVSSQYGVSLTLTTNSSNLTCSLAPNTYFPAGTIGSTVLWCTATATGNYAANITGVSGTFTHSLAVTYHIQDFILTTGSTSLTVDQGLSAATTITVTPVNGFNKNVTLSLRNSAPNLYCSLSQTNFPAGSGTATLSCNSGVPGNYAVTVTVSSVNRTQFVNVSYNVQNTSIFGASPAVFYSALGIAIIAAFIAAFFMIRRERLSKPKFAKR